jgi:three-Cys-motif partner protein
MSEIKTTLWNIEEHTKAKHEILRRYLGAWFPILGSTSKKINYIDGFSGPGRYQQGEPGSPIIALQIAESCKERIGKTITNFLFIDKDPDRIAHLHEEIKAFNLPPNFKVTIENEEFEKVLSRVLTLLETSNKQLAPTFSFIDPFGWKGLPFSIIKRLLGNHSSEVLINIMIGSINRFVDHPNEIDRQYIRDLFGVSEQQIEGVLNSNDRKTAFCTLYQSQLLTSARFVRFFQMCDANDRAIYYLFFATNNPLGHEKMKEAFWNVDKQGGFKFSDQTNRNQLILFETDPSKDVADLLKNKYMKSTLLSEDVIRAVEDETPYISKHVRHALELLEKEGIITVEEKKVDGTRRTWGFPKGVKIHFI